MYASTVCPVPFFPITTSVGAQSYVGGLNNNNTYDSLDITHVTGMCPPLMYVQFMVVVQELQELPLTTGMIGTDKKTYSYYCPSEIDLLLANRLRSYLEHSVASLITTATTVAKTTSGSSRHQNPVTTAYVENFQFVRGVPPCIPDIHCDPGAVHDLIISSNDDVASEGLSVSQRRRYNIQYIGCTFSLAKDLLRLRGTSAHGNSTYNVSNGVVNSHCGNQEMMNNMQSLYIHNVSQALLGQLNLSKYNNVANILPIDESPVITVEAAGYINVDVAASLPRVIVLSCGG